MNGFCIVCGYDIEIHYCCNGVGCGCMGQPTEPPVCGDICYDILMNNFQKYYPSIGKQVSLDINTDLDSLFEIDN